MSKITKKKKIFRIRLKNIANSIKKLWLAEEVKKVQGSLKEYCTGIVNGTNSGICCVILHTHKFSPLLRYQCVVSVLALSTQLVAYTKSG